MPASVPQVWSLWTPATPAAFAGAAALLVLLLFPNNSAQPLSFWPTESLQLPAPLAIRVVHPRPAFRPPQSTVAVATAWPTLTPWDTGQRPPPRPDPGQTPVRWAAALAALPGVALAAWLVVRKCSIRHHPPTGPVTALSIAETPPDAVTIALQADAVYGTACSVIYYALDPPFEWASGPRFARLMRESLRDGVGMLSEYDYDYENRAFVSPAWPRRCWALLHSQRRAGLASLLPRRATVAVLRTVRPKVTADLKQPRTTLGPDLQQQPALVYALLFMSGVVAYNLAQRHATYYRPDASRKDVRAEAMTLLEKVGAALGVEIENPTRMLKIIEEGYHRPDPGDMFDLNWGENEDD
eukprot:EG_transcript_17094